jgi:hypothetical protein
MKTIISTLVGIALMVALAASALATPILQLKLSGDGPDVIIDGTNGKLIQTNLNYGSFVIDLIAASSSLPNFPNLNKLFITSFSVVNKDKNPKTLTISITGTDYGLSYYHPGPDNAVGSFAVMDQSYVQSASGLFQSFLSSSNNPFALDTLIGEWSQNPMTTNSPDTITRSLSLLPQKFSLTEVIMLTQGGCGETQFSAGTEIVPTPEPYTVMLLGCGCFALAIYSKRRRNA